MANVRKHIIIPEELDSKVWKINGPSKKQYSKTVSFLLERGIDNLALNENISFNNSMLEKIYARDGYCIDLIEQLYKELDMKAKLENFKKKRNSFRILFLAWSIYFPYFTI